MSGKKANGKNSQDRSINASGQRVGLFQRWEAGVWALGFPQAPGSDRSPSWRRLCPVGGHMGWARLTKRWDPAFLDTTTGTLGWGGTGVRQRLLLTWSDPSFLGGSEESHSRVRRAGWFTHNLSFVLCGCAGLSDTGRRGRVVLGWGQRLQSLEGAPFCWVGWSFKEGRHSSAPSSAGNGNWDW